jgi:hypothetical protein
MNGYKPVLPSSLIEERGNMDMSFEKKLSENMYLRLGTVVEIYEIEDEENVSKLVPEYDVMTIEDDNTSTYKNCMSFDSFGGVTDFFMAKLRKPKDAKKVREKGSLKKQNGSLVLLLCIDGSSEQGIILGAVAHPDRKTGKLTKALGHHAEGEFNGINYKIDKDGALTILFRSATDNDGKVKDEKLSGSKWKIEKDGSIEFTDGNKELIRIDKTKKTITVVAESDISMTTDANANITAKKNISAKATADMLMDAGGSFTAKSGGAFNITSEGPASLKAPDLKIAVDNMLQIKASTVVVSAPSISLGDGGTPALVLSTQFLGIGNLGAPVISQAIGPFSATVFIAP